VVVHQLISEHPIAPNVASQGAPTALLLVSRSDHIVGEIFIGHQKQTRATMDSVSTNSGESPSDTSSKSHGPQYLRTECPVSNLRRTPPSIPQAVAPKACISSWRHLRDLDHCRLVKCETNAPTEVSHYNQSRSISRNQVRGVADYNNARKVIIRSNARMTGLISAFLYCFRSKFAYIRNSLGCCFSSAPKFSLGNRASMEFFFHRSTLLEGKSWVSDVLTEAL
jgi:hypothetical protein